MLQTFYELPKRAIERSGHAKFFATVGDRAIHEVNLRLALRKNVLQHAGLVLAGSIRTLLHERAGIAMELDAKSLRDRFAFRDKRVEERSSLRKASGSAVMQQRERADRIGRSVENELGPLRATGVLQRNDFQPCAIEQLGQFFDTRIGSARRFEGTDPGVSVNVEAHMAGLDYVTCRKRGAANDVAHVLGKNLFVADAILHRTNGVGIVEDVRGLLNCRTRVRTLGGNDSELARRNFLRIGCGVQARGEIDGATDAQPALVYGASMVLGDIIGVNFHIREARQVCAENAADSAASDDTNLDAHAVFRASSPV